MMSVFKKSWFEAWIRNCAKMSLRIRSSGGIDGSSDAIVSATISRKPSSTAAWTSASLVSK